MNSLKKAIAVALIAIALASVAYGIMEVLWTQNPTMLVYLKYYDAFLSNAVKADVLAGTPTTTWTRTAGNDHEYTIALNIVTMNQIDEGVLRINVSGIPSYLSVNVSSVELRWIQYQDGQWNQEGLVSTLASNVALCTEITIVKADVLRNVPVPAGGGLPQYTNCYWIYIALSEYQTASSGTETTIDLTTEISLGVSSFA